MAVLTLVFIAIGLVACGGQTEKDPTRAKLKLFEITLDFYPNPDHAGIYMAQKLGYFEDAGLNVYIHKPVVPTIPVRYVAEGVVDLAISYQPQVLMAHDDGRNVVAVDAIVDRPLTSLIWLRRSGIEGVADLRGKTVATAGIPYQDAYLKAILAREGVAPDDVETLHVGYDLLPTLSSGRADAILGGFGNVEGVDLQLQSEKPVVTPVDELGVPNYDELVAIVRQDRLRKDPRSIQSFLTALQRGTAAAKKDPEAVTKAILEANAELDPSPRSIRAQVRATLPLLSTSGRMAPAKWARFIAWMQKRGLIKKKPPLSAVLSNELVPAKTSK